MHTNTWDPPINNSELQVTKDRKLLRNNYYYQCSQKAKGNLKMPSPCNVQGARRQKGTRPNETSRQILNIVIINRMKFNHMYLMLILILGV